MQTNIDFFKQKFSLPTSEEIFGFMEQPDEQCPNIDMIISVLEKCNKSIQGSINDLRHIEDTDDVARDIDWVVDDILLNKELEDLRLQIQNLRTWGTEWKGIAKYFLNSMNKNDFDEFIINNYQS